MLNVCVCVSAHACVCEYKSVLDGGEFRVEIMHRGLMCNYWHIFGISRGQTSMAERVTRYEKIKRKTYQYCVCSVRV